MTLVFKHWIGVEENEGSFGSCLEGEERVARLGMWLGGKGKGKGKCFAYGGIGLSCSFDVGDVFSSHFAHDGFGMQRLLITRRS